MYILLERAIEETHQALVYHIKVKLKQNSRHVRNVNITFSCTESQFFGVFKGFIHNYYPKTGTYKCIFRGAD
ncbi:3342_t:CDS:1, partial [Diversispora eburnea]